MNVKRLRYFFAVADEGNFSRAAERLGIAQPPLSRQVKQLEDDIGVRLFNRGSGAITLTQAGRYLYENGRSALLAIERLESEVSQIGKGSEGRLIVGIGGPSTYDLFLKMAKSFNAAYPKVDLSIVPMTGNQLHLALVRRMIDVGITAPPLQDPAIKTRKLMEKSFVVAVPSSWGDIVDEGMSIADLKGLRLIGFPESAEDHYFQFVASLYASHGVEIDSPLLTLDLEAAMCLVAAEAGVCILPNSTLAVRREGVKYIGVDPSITVSLSISHRLDEQGLQIHNFVKIAQSTARAEMGANGVHG